VTSARGDYFAITIAPSRRTVTNPKIVSMFNEIIAESLLNIFRAISVTCASDVIFFIFFWFFISGLIAFDVNTKSQLRPD
jgi:hypothetical protein